VDECRWNDVCARVPSSRPQRQPRLPTQSTKAPATTSSAPIYRPARPPSPPPYLLTSVALSQVYTVVRSYN